MGIPDTDGFKSVSFYLTAESALATIETRIQVMTQAEMDAQHQRDKLWENMRRLG